MSDSRQVREVIARFDEVTHRLDRSAASREASGRARGLTRTQIVRKLVSAGIVVALAIVGTVVAGLMLGGIGLGGFFGIVVLAVVALAVIAFWHPRERPLAEFKDEMTNEAVVRRLDALLVRKRHLLPSRAGAQLDAIGAKLPMLESQLAGMGTLDPLAQDARRLMGRHLPDLIDRYERVPAEFRAEHEGDALSVDERLVQGLGAAGTALDELGRKLARDDLDAFETQGRFIESRYRDDDGPARSG